MAFASKSPLVVNSGQFTGPLTNFTMPFFQTAPRFKGTAYGGSACSLLGYDIRPYSDITLTTALTFELVPNSYDPTTGYFEMWILIPSISIGLTIYFGCGDPALTTDASNPTGTWATQFKGVYHGNDNAASTAVVDSTNQFAGVASANTSTLSVAGQITKGLSCAAGVPAVTLQSANPPVTNTNMQNTTLSGLIYLTGNVTNAVIAYVGDAGANGHGFLISDGAGASGHAVSVLAGGKTFTLSGGFTSLSLNAWHHLAVTRDTFTCSMYVDGIRQSSDNSVTPNTATNSNPSYVAAGGSAGAAIIADEVRLANAFSTDDWVLAEANSQLNNAAFCTLGTEVLTTPAQILWAQASL